MSINYLALLGSKNERSEVSTHGTGFIVTFGNTYYCVTCRHVVKESANSKFFLIPKLQKTKNPPGGYSILYLGVPRFHPQDNKLGTFDIAIAEILNADRHSLERNNIIPINLSNNQIVSHLQDGDEMIAEGYPVEYTEELLSENISELLMPYKIKGIIYNIPISKIPQSGFVAPLYEASFAEITDKNRFDKGMSGAIVFKNQLVAGMVLGFGEITHSIPNLGDRKFTGFIFITANRILETIVG